MNPERERERCARSDGLTDGRTHLGPAGSIHCQLHVFEPEELTYDPLTEQGGQTPTNLIRVETIYEISAGPFPVRNLGPLNV